MIVTGTVLLILVSTVLSWRAARAHWAAAMVHPVPSPDHDVS